MPSRARLEMQPAEWIVQTRGRRRLAIWSKFKFLATLAEIRLVVVEAGDVQLMGWQVRCRCCCRCRCAFENFQYENFRFLSTVFRHSLGILSCVKLHPRLSEIPVRSYITVKFEIVTEIPLPTVLNIILPMVGNNIPEYPVAFGL
jgi:hypothetical protein